MKVVLITFMMLISNSVMAFEIKNIHTPHRLSGFGRPTPIDHPPRHHRYHWGYCMNGAGKCLIAVDQL
jgi:hypothetical protein